MISHQSIAENPMLHAYFMALSSIEPEVLPIEGLHCCCDLDLDLMTFIYELDPYPLKIPLQTKSELLRLEAFESYWIT